MQFFNLLGCFVSCSLFYKCIDFDILKPDIVLVIYMLKGGFNVRIQYFGQPLTRIPEEDICLKCVGLLLYEIQQMQYIIVMYHYVKRSSGIVLYHL